MNVTNLLLPQLQSIDLEILLSLKPRGRKRARTFNFVLYPELETEERKKVHAFLGSYAKCGLSDTINVAESFYAVFLDNKIFSAVRIFTRDTPDKWQAQRYYVMTYPYKKKALQVTQYLLDRLNLRGNTITIDNPETKPTLATPMVQAEKSSHCSDITMSAVNIVSRQSLTDILRMENEEWETSHDAETLQRMITNEAAFVEVANSQDNNLLGFWVAYNGHRGSGMLFLDAIIAEQRHKLGTALLTDLIKFGKEKQYSSILANVSPYNARMLHLLLSKAGGWLVSFMPEWYSAGPFKETLDRTFVFVDLMQYSSSKDVCFDTKTLTDCLPLIGIIPEKYRGMDPELVVRRIPMREAVRYVQSEGRSPVMQSFGMLSMIIPDEHWTKTGPFKRALRTLLEHGYIGVGCEVYNNKSHLIFKKETREEIYAVKTPYYKKVLSRTRLADRS